MASYAYFFIKLLPWLSVILIYFYFDRCCCTAKDTSTVFLTFPREIKQEIPNFLNLKWIMMKKMKEITKIQQKKINNNNPIIVSSSLILLFWLYYRVKNYIFGIWAIRYNNNFVCVCVCVILCFFNSPLFFGSDVLLIATSLPMSLTSS